MKKLCLVAILSLLAASAGYVLANPLPYRCGNAQGGANGKCEGCLKSGDEYIKYFDPQTFYLCDVTASGTCDQDASEVQCWYTRHTKSDCSDKTAHLPEVNMIASCK